MDFYEKKELEIMCGTDPVLSPGSEQENFMYPGIHGRSVQDIK